MNSRLFISDLHLAPERPDIIRLFTRFCSEVASHAQELYILGDFVEYWLGDDDPAAGLQPAFDALTRLSDSGVRIRLMHGNRDFLIGDTLAARCGFEIIPDPSELVIEGHPVLLMHGDTLCTDDVDYLAFRRKVRDPAFLDDFKSKSLAERQQIARSMRKASKEATAGKKPEIMDVNQDAVIDAMRQHNTALLIHGHTHRPAIHEFTLEDKPCKRIVLPDWYETGSYLVLDQLDAPRLVEFG